MNEDPQLLRRFVKENSEAAFRELVHRRIDFVYAAALRQVGGDSHLAAEVAQDVFLDLARKAAGLAGRPNIVGWLYTSARFAAAKARRSRARRLDHEQKASVMETILSATSAPETNWEELRPILDDVLHELGANDREAILLRYFNGCSFAEVGESFGLAENSARMRVDRALEKLRERLARRGITSTAAALGSALVAQPLVAAPAGLAASVAGASLAGAAAAVVPLIGFMSITKIAVGTVAAVVLVTGAYLGGRYRDDAQIARLEKEIMALRADSRAAADKAVRDLAIAGNSGSGRAAGLKAEGGLNKSASRGGGGAKQSEDDLVRAALEAAEGARIARGGRGGAGPREVPGAAGPLDPAPAGSLGMLADLQNRGLVRMATLAFVEPNGKLSSAFKELFALTPDEQGALQRSVDGASDRLAELEKANASLSRDENGNLIIAIKPFAREGGAIYDELMKSFSDALGTERNSAFKSLGASQVESALGGLGAAERTVTISVVPNATGEKAYRVQAKLKTPTLSGTTLHTFDSLDDAMNSVGTVARLVPPDFGR